MDLQKLKRLLLLLCLLFSLPLITWQLPFPAEVVTEKKEAPHYVYASTESPPAPTPAPTQQPFRLLMLFTHSHESYKPIVQETSGLQAVYDEDTNIYSLQQMIAHYLQLNDITPQFVDFDVMTEMKLTNASFHQAYKVVRPVLADYLKEQSYELVIDLHRDSAGKKATTLNYEEETYAKIAFVVGAEHSGYKSNLEYATKLSDKVNEIVPGISRGILKKEGSGVNGIYNQDLAPNMLLIELGGIDNTEQELQRTMAVLARAIRLAFVEQVV